jgi:hypothetical protein
MFVNAATTPSTDTQYHHTLHAKKIKHCHLLTQGLHAVHLASYRVLHDDGKQLLAAAPLLSHTVVSLQCGVLSDCTTACRAPHRTGLTHYTHTPTLIPPLPPFHLAVVDTTERSCCNSALTNALAQPQ